MKPYKFGLDKTPAPDKEPVPGNRYMCVFQGYGAYSSLILRANCHEDAAAEALSYCADTKVKVRHVYKMKGD